MIMSQRTILLIIIITAAALLRFVPHPPNFTPLIAIGILSVAGFKTKGMQFGLPLGIMVLTDVVIGFHAFVPIVYLSIVCASLSGYLLKSKQTLLRGVGSAFLGSVIFFVLTNLGVWLISGMYPLTLSGLTTCFSMAIPFFHNTLAATVLVMGAVYGCSNVLVLRVVK